MAKSLSLQTKNDVVEQITDFLFIGGITTKAEVDRNNIKYSINTCSFPTEYKSESHPISNDAYNDPKSFIEILKKIDWNVKKGNTPVFISCQMGMSRSPTIAALYLYYSKKYPSFDDALYFVMQKSKVAMPNPELVDFVKDKVLPLL